MLSSFIAFFIFVFGLLSSAFAQEEVSKPLTLTINWPAAVSEQILVLLMPDGGNCMDVMDGSSEESSNYNVLYGHGGLTWMSRSNVNINIGVGETFTLCTYEKDQHGRFIYVPLSMILDIPYQSVYEYTPVLPTVSTKVVVQAPPVAPPDTKRPEHFEPTSTVLLGVAWFPGWERLTPALGFMVVPRSLPFSTTRYQ